MPIDPDSDPVAHIDLDQMLEGEDVGGVLRSLVRKCRVTSLLPEELGYDVIWQALEAAGIPSIPSGLSGEGFENLILTKRVAKVIDGDAGTVDVILHYDHPINHDHQELVYFEADSEDPPDPDTESTIYAGIHASMHQTTTNFYYNRNFDPPKKTTITVQYTYPTEAQAKAAKLIPSLYAGETHVQGGEATIFHPHRVLRFGGYINTENPELIEADLLGALNEEYWAAQPPGTWMCTEAHWEPVVMGERYKFKFEFHNNPDGWDPEIVFINEETGKPPPDLVKGVGKKTIPYFDRRDFNQAFGGATINGM